MPTDYDAIAGRYREAKRQPWRGLVESYTLMGLVGDPTGLAAVDLACGEGHYTRALRRLGASPVVGVDRSGGMVDLARIEEEARPLGLSYLAADAREPGLPATSDLAVAAYLLNYARDRDELGAMCRGVASCLRPGGRFVSVNSNPALDPSRAPSHRALGFEVAPGDWAEPGREGAPIVWTFLLESGPLRVENYALGMAAHEQALREAGFEAIRWHPPRLSPGADALPDPGRWAPLLEHPPIAFLECRKAG